MQRIESILNNPEFQAHLFKNHQAETNRIYCRHDLTHFLDVSRIAVILSLEEKLDIDKEIIYASSLLHDIGRWMEYENGADHAAASVELAAEILRQCRFSDPETAEILAAIGGHRDQRDPSPLGGILFRADKLSRNCSSCNARGSCKKFQNGEEPHFQY